MKTEIAVSAIVGILLGLFLALVVMGVLPF